MKKVLFLFGFLFALSLGSMNAQSCSASTAGKSCCSSKMSKAASADATIEKRVDDKGTVSYVRKESDAQGNVKFVSVQFDEGTSTFVNVAPKSMTADAKEGMVKKETKACASEAKACTKAEGKGCCKSGAAATKTCSTKDEVKAAPANQ